MNYNPEMEGTPVENFLLGLKWANLLLLQTFKVGRHTSLIQILSLEDTPLIWLKPSPGSLCEDVEEVSFCSFPTCPFLLEHPLLC